MLSTTPIYMYFISVVKHYKGFFYDGVSIHSPQQDPRYLPLKYDLSIWTGLSSITKTRLFKVIENFTTKKGKLQIKKIWYFSYFCSKHRLWVLTSTHNLFFSKIRKIMYTPVNSSFTIYIKWGLRGSKLYRYVFLMDSVNSDWVP